MRTRKNVQKSFFKIQEVVKSASELQEIKILCFIYVWTCDLSYVVNIV
jgi:hypothetical protein